MAAAAALVVVIACPRVQCLVFLWLGHLPFHLCQYEINVHALRRYQAYIYAYALVCDDDDGVDAAAAIDAATTDLERLEQLVQKMRHT